MREGPPRRSIPTDGPSYQDRAREPRRKRAIARHALSAPVSAMMARSGTRSDAGPIASVRGARPPMFQREV